MMHCSGEAQEWQLYCSQSLLDWQSKKVRHSTQSFSPNRFAPVTVEVLSYRKESRRWPGLGGFTSLCVSSYLSSCVSDSVVALSALARVRCALCLCVSLHVFLYASLHSLNKFALTGGFFVSAHMWPESECADDHVNPPAVLPYKKSGHTVCGLHTCFFLDSLILWEHWGDLGVLWLQTVPLLKNLTATLFQCWKMLKLTGKVGLDITPRKVLQSDFTDHPRYLLGFLKLGLLDMIDILCGTLGLFCIFGIESFI